MNRLPVLLVFLLACAACVTTPRPQSRALPTGQDVFRRYCASCHGEDARGNGPVAPLLQVPVPDLTRIAARRGGQFSGDEIFRIIDGQAPLEAHGPRHMPVWGYEFFGGDADDEMAHAQATTRVDQLVSWLRGIQRVP